MRPTLSPGVTPTGEIAGLRCRSVGLLVGTRDCSSFCISRGPEGDNDYSTANSSLLCKIGYWSILKIVGVLYNSTCVVFMALKKYRVR